jgi:hypothetical protein
MSVAKSLGTAHTHTAHTQNKTTAKLTYLVPFFDAAHDVLHVLAHDNRLDHL